VSGISAGHDPLRHVQASTGEIGATIHVSHAAHRTAMNAHAQLQARMVLARAADLDCALRRCDPLSPVINSDLGSNLMVARRYDEAIAQLRKTLEIAGNG
jgi:hypothetical protein